MIRATVHFSGRVQGVGFRYTTATIAQRFGVAGYVENLQDARVRLVAEGNSIEIYQLIEQIQEQIGSYIASHTVEHSEPTGEFGAPDSTGTFNVRY